MTIMSGREAVPGNEMRKAEAVSGITSIHGV